MEAVTDIRDAAGDQDRDPILLRNCLLSLVDATPGLVMVSNGRGRLLYMNGKGRAMLGIDRGADISLRKMFDLYSPQSCELLLGEAIPTCLQAGNWRGEMCLVDSVHAEVPVSQVLMAHRVQQRDGAEITVFSSIAWDIRDMKQVEHKLRHQATHDSLTGLPNRALLMDRLDHAIQVASRNGTIVGLLFLDLDGFKQVNDTLGHEVANLLLRELGHRLKDRVRAEDTVARYGGDEFVLLVPDLAAPGDIMRVLEKVQEALDEPFVIGRESTQVAASIGVAMYPLDGRDADALLRRADRLMYEQKRHLKIATPFIPRRSSLAELPGAPRAEILPTSA
jgi:diguanylate cyclase (GGDEF)-like protein